MFNKEINQYSWQKDKLMRDRTSLHFILGHIFTQRDKTRKAIENSVRYKIAVGNDSFRDLWGATLQTGYANARVIGLSKHRQDDISIITYRP